MLPTIPLLVNLNARQLEVALESTTFTPPSLSGSPLMISCVVASGRQHTASAPLSQSATSL
jgi:hypothetical protein